MTVKQLIFLSKKFKIRSFFSFKVKFWIVKSKGYSKYSTKRILKNIFFI